MTTKTLLEMRRLYDQKLPDAKIAKAVGVSTFSVFHWRRENGLPCWKNYYEVRDRMTDDLIASGTARECAEAMGYYKEEAFRRMARNALRGERLTRRVVTMEKRNGLDGAPTGPQEGAKSI